MNDNNDDNNNNNNESSEASKEKGESNSSTQPNYTIIIKKYSKTCAVYRILQMKAKMYKTQNIAITGRYRVYGRK